MKLGVVSSILDQSSFEEMIDICNQYGLESVEVACWPTGKAERRYAGVSHIDVNNLDEDKASNYLNYAKEKGIELSSLAYYPNPLDENLDNRQIAIEHLYKVIDASSLLRINMVTTFIGRMQSRSLTENLKEVKTIWKPIVDYAEAKGVKIAIENCPMLFTEDEWPGGQNIMTTPDIYQKVFAILDSDYIGLNFDPSHYVWQQMDYIKTIYDFKDKIFHIHFKDIKIFHDKLNEFGILSAPLNYMSPKLPGLGDVDFGKFVSALTDINYRGFACIEVEDKAYEDTYERVKLSVKQSSEYMRNYIPKN